MNHELGKPRDLGDWYEDINLLTNIRDDPHQPPFCEGRDGDEEDRDRIPMHKTFPNGSVVALARGAPVELALRMTLLVFDAWEEHDRRKAAT